MPRTGFQTPTRPRTSDDLPDPLGPMMPTPWPASTTNATSCTTIFCWPGGAMASVSTCSLFAGGSSWVTWACAGTAANMRLSRCQLWRAPTKFFQCAIARSTGASARALRIELAMIMPPVACWLMTSQAPTASTADCSIMRITLATAPMPPATSAARCWLARYSAFAALQRAPSRCAMPIATRASALRRLAAARSLRRAARRVASLAGSRVRSSVSSVSATRRIAPISAASPIKTWNAKQMPR